MALLTNNTRSIQATKDQPNGLTRFVPLDGIRGVAVLLVVYVHSFVYVGPLAVGRALDTLARAGWIGVTLFFVLSGFLITGILLDTNGSPNYFLDFFARRSLRIFPLYFSFLAFYFFLVPHLPYLSEHLAQPSRGLSVYYWTYLANMKEWFGGSSVPTRPLDPLWSLAVEEQVYLVWPVLISVLPRRFLPAMFLVFGAASFCWRLATRYSAQSIEMSYAWMPANLGAFSAGGLVAWLSRSCYSPHLKKYAPHMICSSGFFVLGMFAGERHFNFWEGPVQVLTVGISGVIGTFGGLIAYSISSDSKSWLNRSMSASWLCQLGRYSYAIYVVHSCFIALLRPFFPVGTPSAHNSWSTLAQSVLFTLLVLAASSITAAISGSFLEQPIQRLKRYFPLSGHVTRVA